MKFPGRASIALYVRPGFRLVANIAFRQGYYRVTLELNGAPVRTARRPTLTSALRWAMALSARLLDTFGQTAEPVSLSRAYRDAAGQLVA